MLARSEQAAACRPWLPPFSSSVRRSLYRVSHLTWTRLSPLVEGVPSARISSILRSKRVLNLLARPPRGVAGELWFLSHLIVFFSFSSFQLSLSLDDSQKHWLLTPTLSQSPLNDSYSLLTRRRSRQTKLDPLSTTTPDLPISSPPTASSAMLSLTTVGLSVLALATAANAVGGIIDNARVFSTLHVRPRQEPFVMGAFSTPLSSSAEGVR